MNQEKNGETEIAVKCSVLDLCFFIRCWTFDVRCSTFNLFPVPAMRSFIRARPGATKYEQCQLCVTSKCACTMRIPPIRSGPGVNSFKEFRRKPFKLALDIELLLSHNNMQQKFGIISFKRLETYVNTFKNFKMRKLSVVLNFRHYLLLNHINIKAFMVPILQVMV